MQPQAQYQEHSFALLVGGWGTWEEVVGAHSTNLSTQKVCTTQVSAHSTIISGSLAGALDDRKHNAESETTLTGNQRLLARQTINGEAIIICIPNPRSHHAWLYCE